MPIQIHGWGTAHPPFFATQDQAAQAAAMLWAEALDRGNAVRALYRRTDVQTRYSSILNRQSDGELPDQSFYHPATGPEDRGPTTAARMQRYEACATALGTQACETALAESGLPRESITHLVTVSCSGFSAPGFDIGLIQALNLPRTVSRSHIGFMGCHGALNGLRVARAFAAQNPGSRVLVCCVELCSLHQQYTIEPQQVVANALFSDGAAAVVLSEGTTKTNWNLDDQYSELIPDTHSFMTWRIGDHGFEMTLSPETPGLFQSLINSSISTWLSLHNLTVPEIQSWAIHPGGPRILTSAADGLGIDRRHLATSQSVLSKYGNMSSPTILFILNQLRQTKDSRPCVALAFGPGLTLEAALFR